MTDNLNGITNELIDSVTIIDNQLDITIDRLTRPPGATDLIENGNEVRTNDDGNNENNDTTFETNHFERIPLPASFVNTSTPSAQGDSATSAFLGLLSTLSDNNGAEPNNQEASSQEHISLQVQHESDPFNEFEANDRLLYSTFSFLFLLGRGLKTSGSLSSTTTRHILLQFHGVFSACFRFIFLLFDQFQRHAATRIVASRVNSDPAAFSAFASWISDPNFLLELKEAAANPLSDKAKQLLKKITPHVDTCTAKIPYSSGERKASMINLYSMVYFYGMPSVFFTFAPDDINGVLNLRLSIPQKKQSKFLCHRWIWIC